MSRRYQFGGHAGGVGHVERPALPVGQDDANVQAGVDGRLQERAGTGGQDAEAGFVCGGVVSGGRIDGTGAGHA